MSRTASLEEHPELLRIRDREGMWITSRTIHGILDPHLPPGEEVRELLLGAYVGGRGLLALTDVRVVLAQEPRAGRASAAVPLTDVTAVEWARHGPTGELTVRTATASHHLRHADLHHGPAVTAAVLSAWQAQTSSHDAVLAAAAPAVPPA